MISTQYMSSTQAITHLKRRIVTLDFKIPTSHLVGGKHEVDLSALFGEDFLDTEAGGEGKYFAEMDEKKLIPRKEEIHADLFFEDLIYLIPCPLKDQDLHTLMKDYPCTQRVKEQGLYLRLKPDHAHNLKKGGKFIWKLIGQGCLVHQLQRDVYKDYL